MIITSWCLAGCVVRPGVLPAGQARVWSALLTTTALPFTAKIPGENGPIVTALGAEAMPPTLTTTFTVCVELGGTMFQGTWALIRSGLPGPTNSRGAFTGGLLPLTN